MSKTLKRVTFETSRLLEFFTVKELTMQIGHEFHHWPIAIVKELLDNALDACETANIAPSIEVEIGDEWFSVSDNGAGIPEETIIKSLDYMVRVSDKNYYVSPTRGQLGNALKCVYAAPYVMDGERGLVTIETGTTRYEIDLSLDRIAQQPVLKLNTQNGIPERRGVKITVFYTDLASLLDERNPVSFYVPPTATELVRDYSMFNPHTKFTFLAEGDQQVWFPTDTEWSKWKPDNPTSAHWYDENQLRDLIAAYLASGNDKSLRLFVAEFRGLSGTAKQKTVAEGIFQPNLKLSDMVEDGDINMGCVEPLLNSMKEHSKPVRAALLGVIGKEHISKRMIENYRVAPESIKYKKITNQTGLPHVLEMAFGVFEEGYEACAREVVNGLNWSAALGLPVREFQQMLGQMRVDRHDPVCIVFHLARPIFDFVDRGKGQLDV